MNISKLSPLYEYWSSEQDEDDERKRLIMLNPDEPASDLFKNEPYKWENLFRSALSNVINGNESSTKGLMVILSTISKGEQDKLINSLENLLSYHVIDKLRNKKYYEINSNRNIFNTFRVLLIIFINPYQLELKKEPKHLYEKTGMFFYKFRKLFLLNK